MSRSKLFHTFGLISLSVIASLVILNFLPSLSLLTICFIVSTVTALAVENLEVRELAQLNHSSKN